MAIQKKTEGRDLEEYLQEVWDSLEPAWDKSKFDMKQGYDSEYECDCITITSKDNEGVRAKIYVNDYEGKHPVGFDVVYRYPGDKGVGVMGSYEFQSTDMDNLGEEVFDYFDEIKKKAAGASFESDLQAYADAVKADKYDKQSVIDDGWEYDNSVEYDEDIVRDNFKQKYDGKTYLLHITFNPSTKDVSDVKWDISAIESKQTEEAGSFKVGDFVNYDAESDGDKLSTGWAFAEVVAVNEDGTLKLQPYNLEDYDEVDGVNPQFCEKMEHFAGMTDANTYYMDGKYNVYKGYYEIYVTIKELGKPYGFAGTLDSLDDVEQLMDYYDETMVYDQDIQDEVMSAVYGLTHYDEEDLKGINFADLSDKTESKKSEGLPPKKLGDRRYRSRADLINKMKQLGATEITTRDQYDELRNKQWLHKSGYAMDINGNLVGQTYFGDKDGKWYYATTKTFQGDYLPECKEESKKSESTENTTESERISFIKDLANKLGIDDLEEDRASAHMSGWRYFNNDDEGGDGVVLSLKAYPWARDDQSATIDVWLETGSGVIGDCWLSFDFGGDYKNRINADTILTTLKNQLHTLWSRREGVAKKSESLTLKQKELKDMARFGQAEDITTISDEEAKALRKKGIETIGVSRGTYGMNGALLRDNEGKKYVITARSSNLFYFV